MVWTCSKDRQGFTGGLGSIEIKLTLILESGGGGFGGKSRADWGQIMRLWIFGDFIFDWRKVISLFMFLTFLARLLVAHIVERTMAGWQEIRLVSWNTSARLWVNWRTERRT